MKCHAIREALSARIDGEPDPLPAQALDRHLTGCSECQDWYRRAQELRRVMIVRPAPPVPDATAAIMARLPEPRKQRQWVRPALAVVAVGQTVLAVTELCGMGEMESMGHISHESAAWNVAIGIGLLWAAVRTRAAAGQLPMLTAFVGVLAGASLLDLIRDQVTVGRLVTHVPVLLGVMLLYLVARDHGTDDPPARLAAVPVPEPEQTEVADCESGIAGRITGESRGFQRPASSHPAA